MKPAVLMKNRKLRTERKMHGWSQARLAEVLGVTTRTVIRWEQGLAVPQPNYRKKLGTLFGKTAQELGLLWDTDEHATVQEVSPPALHIVTPDTSVQGSLLPDSNTPQNLGRINRLIGRTNLLTQVKQRLLEADSLTFTALHGSPSVGKTTLAVALTMDQEVQACFPDGILWAPLGPQPHVLGQLMRWGNLLGVAPSDVRNPESPLAWSQALQSAIGSRQMLLVIDDAWTTENALALQIGGPQCAYLLTTRQSQVAFTLAEQRSIIVPPLEEADGLVLLAHFVPQMIQHDPDGARSLVQATSSLPLALILMGNYLASPTLTEQPWPLRTALAQLYDTQEHLRISMLSSPAESRPNLAESTPLSLYATIAICAQQLSPQTQATLDAIAIFPPKPQSFSEEAALTMSQQPRETLEELCNAGLLENLGPSRYSLHPTVADYARARVKSQWSNRDW
jgi:transcriptional regulator with XRE-family HTH domain